MQNVRELLLDAVKENQSLLAHSLYIAIQQNIIKSTDSAVNIPFKKFPMDDCLNAHKKNLLCMHPTKMFAVPHNNFFAYYFAKNEQDVIDLHKKLFGHITKKPIDVSERIYMTIYDEEKKRYEDLYELRDKTMKLPAFIFTMKGKKR